MDETDTILYQDESTFYQSGIPRKMYARKGSKPELQIYGTHSKVNVFGIINAITGASHFQYIDRLNADCFLKFLDLILKEYKDSKMIYMVIDNAPGHRANKVRQFEELNKDRLTLIRLPPYSPDFNPIEIVWRELKKDVVYNTFYPFVKDFRDALTSKLRGLEPSRVQSICNISKYGICLN